MLASTAPKHRRDIHADATPLGSKCICRTGPHSICPRHDPREYADSMARHSIDSIRPVIGAAR